MHVRNVFRYRRRQTLQVHRGGRWTGGLFGAAYGLTAILLANAVGAGTLMALVVTGQLVSSIIIDHFGWLGFDVHPASWPRIIGCGLMIIGLALIAKF